jgi:DNA-binding NarL/FixJ family response regulator
MIVRMGNPSAGHDPTGSNDLAQAEAASARRDWQTACATYARLVDGASSPSGSLLVGWAQALKFTGAFSEALHATERAYRAFIEVGDRIRAIRCTTQIAGLRMMFGDRAGADAWLRRGWQHLDETGPCVERGYHALAYVACDIQDASRLRELAELALTVARQFDDRALELRASADKGLALVSSGNVDEGFVLLDEVMVGIIAGEIPDAQMRGVTLCALLTACERSSDHGRADHWGQTIEASPALRDIGILTTHCQLAFGAMDVMRGRFASAETRLKSAIDAAATTRYHAAASRARLAELWIQQGRYDETAELLRGYEDEFEASQALAHLCVASGEHARAAAVLRTYTRGLGSDCLRLAPALALLVELYLRCDDVGAASAAGRQLLALEEECSSNEIRAMARLASGRIANYKLEYTAAIEDLETALMLLMHRDRPLITAQVRLDLGRALGGSGDRAGALVELQAAKATLERLGIVPDLAACEAVTRRLLDSCSEAAENGERPRLLSGEFEKLTRRESEIVRLVAEGLTNRAIAARLVLSVRTVETHVDRAMGKLDFHTRSQLTAWVVQEPRVRTT